MGKSINVNTDSSKGNVIDHGTQSLNVWKHIFNLGNKDCIETVQSCRYLMTDSHIGYISCTDILP